MLTVFKLLLFLGYFGSVFSHWICDSAKKPCSDVTLQSEYLKVGLADWFNGSSEVDQIVTESVCAMVCQEKNCGAYVFSEGEILEYLT